MLVNLYQRKNSMQNAPDTIGTSPIPMSTTVKPITLSFQEAIALVLQGSKITRVDWNNNEEYGFLRNELLSIHTKGKDHTWLVSEADMRAIDWIVVR